MTETEIKKQILDGLATMDKHIHIFRVWCGQTFAKKGGLILGAKKGTPDLCGFFKTGPKAGTFLGIEVKKPKVQFRPEQYEFGTLANRAGAVVISAGSWEECLMKLEEFI